MNNASSINRSGYVPPAMHMPKTSTSPASQKAGIPNTVVDLDNLLKRKLKDPALKLSSAESIALLTHCIHLGKLDAAKHEKKNLIVFIGNTGAGKSTFVNYLYGCTMQRVSPKTLGLEATEKVIIVKPGSPIDEVMAIGHSSTSETFMPQMITYQKDTFCDCPGFLDNRGPEINIANAVNVKNALRAEGVRVVIMINFHSLRADRAKGLKDMINICCSLFGSKENLVKYKDSILLCVTQTPFKDRVDEDETPETYKVEDLKKWMASEKGISEFDKSALQILSEQLIIYDPCDSKNLKYEGALKRTEILNVFGNLNPITNSQEIFKTVLTPTDIDGLIEITNEIKATIENIFAKPQLNAEDFSRIAFYQESLNQLEVIENPYAARLTAETRHVITQYFQRLVHQFELKCADTSADLSKESEGILKIIKEGIQHFDQQIQDQINTQALDERYAKLILKQAAKKEILRLADLEKDFRTCCAYTNFDKANEILKNIKQSLQNFNSKFSQTDEKLHIDLDQLKKIYMTTKDNYDMSIEEQKAQRKKLDDLERTLERERKERELAAKAAEDKQAQEKKEAEAAFQQLQKEIAQNAKQDLQVQVHKVKQTKHDTQEFLTKCHQHPQMNLPTNKQILCRQILGDGPPSVVQTPMGLQLVTFYGQCHPIVWGTNVPGGIQVVINTVAGFFHIDSSGATQVIMTPAGPVPRFP